jgi:5-formyltetrahydrofolate cyclo-ligase
MLLLVDLQDKQAWRAALLTARRQTNREEADRVRDVHARALTAGKRVAAYASFGTEPDTSHLVEAGWLLPVLHADNDLGWSAHPSSADLGVDAIAKAEVVLVPALAVDRRGVRLGRGGGSYDRALRRATGLVVALLHEGELVDALPSEPHDVRVDAVLLPSGLVRL